ncbi:MAG: chemotaxis protein CheX, partial [Desulfobacterales bacterium]
MSTIKSLDLTTALNNAVTDVFATMLSMEIVPVADPPQPESVEDRLVGTVTFAGEITGIVSIDVSHRFCRLMAASMMEMAPEEIEDDEETKDLLGEVSNIIGGNLKSAFTDEGLSCAISTPAITQGQDFQVQSLNMEIYEQLAYAYGDHLFRLELGVKVQEKSMAGDLEKLDSGPTLTLDEVFSALNLTAKIEESVIDVFDTMLSIELEKIETRPQEQRGG